MPIHDLFRRSVPANEKNCGLMSRLSSKVPGSSERGEARNGCRVGPFSRGPALAIPAGQGSLSGVCFVLAFFAELRMNEKTEQPFACSFKIRWIGGRFACFHSSSSKKNDRERERARDGGPELSASVDPHLPASEASEERSLVWRDYFVFCQIRKPAGCQPPCALGLTHLEGSCRDLHGVE